MTQFPHQSKQQYASIYLEETDRALPNKINPNLRYAYFKMIAKGGKCAVKACKDLHLSRVVCYKTLLPEYADDAIEQQRLLREARVTAMLQHPNTVPIYELGRDNKGHYYFTMKLVHGYTLREVLDYRDRYDLNQLVEVIIQVAHALEYAHSHGVIHRDIKPENILVGPYGEVLLLDWGLAKVWNEKELMTGHEEIAENEEESENIAIDDISITHQGKLQGTMRYMSPEQANKDPGIDARTDIYSLGIILYEILCGKDAVEGNSVDQIMAHIRSDEEAVLPSKRTEHLVPSLLEQVCMKCLHKEPVKRIQTASELIRLLHEDWQP